MKSKGKKVLMIMLAAVTALTMSASSIFAEGTTTTPSTTTGATALTPVVDEWGGAVNPTMNDVNSSISEKSGTFYVNGGLYHGIVYEAEAKETGYMNFNVAYGNGDTSLRAVIGTNAKNFSTGSGYKLLTSNDNKWELGLDVKKGEKVYLALYSYKFDATTNEPAAFTDYYTISAELTPSYTSAQLNAMEMSTIYKYRTKTSQTTYMFGFTATKSGVVGIKPDFATTSNTVTDGTAVGTIYIMDSTKKIVSGKRTAYKARNSYFGVKAGQKYYFVLTPNESYLGKAYTLTLAPTALTYGTSKAKARTLKSGSSYTSYAYIGKTASHWYTFKITKTSRHAITIKTNFVGSCYSQLYRNGKKLSFKSGKYYNLKPGTYMVRMYTTSYRANGAYQLAFK